MAENVITVTDSSFNDDVIRSEKPVLVDFWAPWCGPCKMFAPIVDDIAKDYVDQLVVAKLNVDQNQASANKFGIRGIPTIALFKDGQIIAQQVGSLTRKQLKEFIESNVDMTKFI